MPFILIFLLIFAASFKTFGIMKQKTILSFVDFLLQDVRLSSLHCVFEEDGVSLYFDGVVSDLFLSHLFNATNKFSLTFSISASDNFLIIRVY